MQAEPIKRSEEDTGWGSVPTIKGDLASAVPDPVTGVSPTQVQMAASAEIQQIAQGKTIPPPPGYVINQLDPSGALLMWMTRVSERVGGYSGNPWEDLALMATDEQAPVVVPDVFPEDAFPAALPSSALQLMELFGDVQIPQTASNQEKTRQTVAITTATIAPGSYDSDTITLPKTCEILTVATDYPAEVRLYQDAASRSADLGRGSTIAPLAGHGLVCQNTTTVSTLAINQSPVSVFVNQDSTPVDTGYLTIWNRDSVSRAVTLTLTYLKEE